MDTHDSRSGPQDDESTSTVTLVVRGAIVLMVLGLAVVMVKPDIVPRSKYVALEGDRAPVIGDAMHVLFVGNSHTFVNNVPHIVQQLVPDDAQPLAFDALTAGGKTLAWHAAQRDVADRTSEASYDVVVLQPGSGELINGAPVEDLRRLEAQANGAPVLLYQTWPRHPDRDQAGARIGSIDEWDRIVMQNARVLGRRISPVGSTWVCVHHATRLDLWSADGNHASLLGSYVAGLTLMRSIYGPDVLWREWAPDGMPASIAKQVRDAVAKCMSGD